MANVLLIDTDEAGIFMGMAYKASIEGHKVRLFIPPGPELNPNLAKGFPNIQVIDNWIGSAKWADLILVSDIKKYLPRLKSMREQGINYYGPSPESAKLEMDRKFGMDFMKQHGINLPPYHEFNSMSEAEKFQLKNDKRYVFKPLGTEEDKAMTYASKSPEDLVETLRMWKKMGKKDNQPVMLQEFIPGIEFAVASEMTRNGFIGLPLESFEHKPLMSGDIGPGTGEQGTVQKYVKESLLYDKVLKPFEDALIKLGHQGNIDVNCIIDEKGNVWPLEFTCRHGWPQSVIQLIQRDGSTTDMFIDAMHGKDSLKLKEDHAIGVVLTQPPFPNKQKNWESVERPIFMENENVKRHLMPQSMMQDSYLHKDKSMKKDWMTCGTYFGIMTALGDTVEQSMSRVYKTIDKVHVAQMQYRDDIGERVINKLSDLQKLSFAKEWRGINGK
jgi:phosphoribosylamine---glycine ligase